jgi:hypothetical protein
VSIEANAVSVAVQRFAKAEQLGWDFNGRLKQLSESIKENHDENG